MIIGNALDTFRLVFDDGEEFCLVARDVEHARLTGMELKPGKKITGVYRLDEWGND